MSPPSPAPPSQFALLRQRRFAPFFWTQFFGAANDNLLKFAFTVLVTYQLDVSWLPPAKAGLVISAVFILPFVLLSATAGQLADKLDKASLMRLVKSFELGIMVLATVGLVADQVALLLACIFLMGVHSTVFGPAKYAYLPQHMDGHEITGANGMVEMGTFVAILLGQLAGGLLVAVPGRGRELAAGACVAVAVAGWLSARAIPATPPQDAALRVRWNPVAETLRNLRLAREDKVVFRSLLGISWMWFFGAVFLSQFPAFAKVVLRGDAQVASLLLVLFSVGVGVGSLLCETLSRRRVEIGLVPLGAIGMSLFAIDLYLAVRHLPAPPAELWTLAQFVAHGRHLRLMIDLFMLSLSVGLYSVPMYALIQTRAQPSHRARIIAANNILNALFMVASSLLAGLLLQSGVGIAGVFLATGLANALVSAIVFLLVPEYVVRFLGFVLARVVYRVRVRDEARLGESGAAVLAFKPASVIDPLLLVAASPRPIRFVMEERVMRMPVFGLGFRLARAIPMAAHGSDEAALAEAERVLAEGGLLALFPDSLLLRVLERRGVPVFPVGLHRRRDASVPRVELRVGVPVAPHEASAPELLQRIRALQEAGPH